MPTRREKSHFQGLIRQRGSDLLGVLGEVVMRAFRDFRPDERKRFQIYTLGWALLQVISVGLGLL